MTYYRIAVADEAPFFEPAEAVFTVITTIIVDDDVWSS